MKGRSFRDRTRVVMMWILAISFVGLGYSLACAQSNEVIVTLPGGTLEKVLRRSWVEPFEKKYNAKVIVVTGLTMENLAKLRAQKGSPQIDVVGFDPPGRSPRPTRGCWRSSIPSGSPT